MCLVCSRISEWSGTGEDGESMPAEAGDVTVGTRGMLLWGLCLEWNKDYVTFINVLPGQWSSQPTPREEAWCSGGSQGTQDINSNTNGRVQLSFQDTVKSAGPDTKMPAWWWNGGSEQKGPDNVKDMVHQPLPLIGLAEGSPVRPSHSLWPTGLRLALS